MQCVDDIDPVDALEEPEGGADTRVAVEEVIPTVAPGRGASRCRRRPGTPRAGRRRRPRRPAARSTRRVGVGRDAEVRGHDRDLRILGEPDHARGVGVEVAVEDPVLRLFLRDVLLHHHLVAPADRRREVLGGSVERGRPRPHPLRVAPRLARLRDSPVPSPPRRTTRGRQATAGTRAWRRDAMLVAERLQAALARQLARQVGGHIGRHQPGAQVGDVLRDEDGCLVVGRQADGRVLDVAVTWRRCSSSSSSLSRPVVGATIRAVRNCGRAAVGVHAVLGGRVHGNRHVAHASDDAQRGDSPGRTGPL